MASKMIICVHFIRQFHKFPDRLTDGPRTISVIIVIVDLLTLINSSSLLLGVRPICQHNFGNNRMLKEPRIMLEQ